MSVDDENTRLPPAVMRSMVLTQTCEVGRDNDNGNSVGDMFYCETDMMMLNHWQQLLLTGWCREDHRP